MGPRALDIGPDVEGDAGLPGGASRCRGSASGAPDSRARVRPARRRCWAAAGVILIAKRPGTVVAQGVRSDGPSSRGWTAIHGPGSTDRPAVEMISYPAGARRRRGARSGPGGRCGAGTNGAGRSGTGAGSWAGP
jgi:hypothetical protein